MKCRNGGGVIPKNGGKNKRYINGTWIYRCSCGQVVNIEVEYSEPCEKCGARMTYTEGENIHGGWVMAGWVHDLNPDFPNCGKVKS